MGKRCRCQKEELIKKIKIKLKRETLETLNYNMKGEENWKNRDNSIFSENISINEDET